MHESAPDSAKVKRVLYLTQHIEHVNAFHA